MKRRHILWTLAAVAIGLIVTVRILPRKIPIPLPDGPTTARGTSVFIARFLGPVDERTRQALASVAGVRPLDLVTRETISFEADGAGLAQLSSLKGRTVRPGLPALTSIDPQPMAGRFPDVRPGEITVLPLAETDTEEIVRTLVAHGGEVLGRVGTVARPAIRAHVDASALAALADKVEVRWMENHRRPRLFNDVATGIMGLTNAVVRETLGLTGRGQIITTSDSGIDTGDLTTLHPDLRTNVLGFEVVDGSYAYDSHGHGTHTAGSLVGDGTSSDGRIRGAAPGARLWAWFCGGKDGKIYTPDLFDDLFRPPALSNETAYVHSASWGGETNTYSIESYQIDAYCWSHPDFLPVFAAGNDGVAGTISEQGSAKNVLCVGASESLRSGKGSSADNPAQVASFSSRGPMRDGRIKPEVVAPGSYIVSTRSSMATGTAFGTYGTNYLYNSGTSMSTPLVAGAAAVIRQWLTTCRGVENPTAALVKAVLMGCAVDLASLSGSNVTQPAPNGDEGWGRVDVAASVAPADGCNVLLYDRLPYAGGDIFNLRVTTTNAAPLTAQLVWIDCPKTPDSNRTQALVNNLDLKVEAERDGVPQVWWGNGGAVPDLVNNAERVRIAEAPAGEYVVSVRNTSVFDSTGGAVALYVSGAVDATLTEVTTGQVGCVTLTVRKGSGEGEALPTFGTCEVVKDTVVELSASNPGYAYSNGLASAEHAFVGFVGTGSIPAQGTNDTLKVLLSEDSSVEWRWADEPCAFRVRFLVALQDVCDQRGNTAFIQRDLMLGTNEVYSIEAPEDFLCDETFVQSGFRRRGADWRDLERGRFTMRFCGIEYAPLNGFGELMGFESNLWQAPTSFTLTVDEPCDIVAWYYSQEKADVALGYPDWCPTWWWLRYLDGADCFSDGTVATGPEDDPDGDRRVNRREAKYETDPLDSSSYKRLPSCFMIK